MLRKNMTSSLSLRPCPKPNPLPAAAVAGSDPAEEITEGKIAHTYADQH